MFRNKMRYVCHVRKHKVIYESSKVFFTVCCNSVITLLIKENILVFLHFDSICHLKKITGDVRTTVIVAKVSRFYLQIAKARMLNGCYIT